MTYMMPQSQITQLTASDGLKHIAIVMDGNNRFEKKNALHRGGGHMAGKNTLDPIVEHARRIGLKVLTVFAFSSENWNRSEQEVAMLMELFEKSIVEQIPRMKEHDIAMRFIGERSKLSPKIQQLMQEAEAITAHNQAMTLVIAISYGGMWDITQAAKKLAAQVAQGHLTPQDVTEASLASHLEMSDLPAVDLLIRTGGEYRISNFLLWQAAYAELYFTDVLWPDFTPQELDKAVDAFKQRNRRFGGSNLTL